MAIGIGGMVGGGIFAVLGLSIELARGAAPLALFIAGGVALLTATSYARLSVAYPSRGGTVAFLNETFGAGVFVGGLNVLLWLSYVVMISLYAAACAGYADSLLPGRPSGAVDRLLLSGVIIVIAILNIARASIVGRAEEWIVANHFRRGQRRGSSLGQTDDPARPRRERSRNPWGVLIVGGLVGGSFAMEVGYRKFTSRVIPSHLASLSSALDDPSSPRTAEADGE